MRVLVIGGTGLIGSAVVAALVGEGHSVVAIARRTGAVVHSMPGAQWVALDIAAATRPEQWLPLLEGIDAVVNCAGVLQDGMRDSTRGVHVEGAGALFAACEQRTLRRVIQVSAIGLDRATPTPFSRSKLQGDRDLMQRDLDWVMLRPSVVLGPAAYGGSAMIRALASLPVLPVMPDTGPLQVVQLDDIVDTILFFLRPEAPSRVTLDLAGPDCLSFSEIVCLYRAWLGWPPARALALPRCAAGLLYRIGDLAGLLGWRPPLRSTARRELARGAVGDPKPWTSLTGIAPVSLAAALRARPASVQERWFAGVYVLKPVVFVVLALFWGLTGLLSLGPAYPPGVGLMQEVGAGGLSGPAVIAGGLLDLAIGIGIALRRTTRAALWCGLAVSGLYVASGTVLLPRLWIEPLGPLLKVAPIIVLMLVALAILEDR